MMNTKKLKEWCIHKMGGHTSKELYQAQQNINKQWKKIIMTPNLLALEQAVVLKEKSLLKKMKRSFLYGMRA